MAVDKEKIDELGSPNFGLLCTAWVFFIFSAIWIGDAPFIIIAAPFLFLIRKFTNPHPLDYLVEGKDEYPYTRKGAYWNALQLWFLSVFVFVPPGTNLDAGTVDPKTRWVRYGSKHNDIYRRLGDLIRLQLDLPPRPEVTRAIAKSKAGP